NFEPDSGYVWVAGPEAHGVGWYGGRTHWNFSGYHAVEVDDGDLLVTFGHRGVPLDPAIGDYRAVAFDLQGRRHLLEWDGSTTGSNGAGRRAWLERYRLGPAVFPADLVLSLGIERRTTESRPVTPGAAAVSSSRRNPPGPAPAAAGRFAPGRDASWAI